MQLATQVSSLPDTATVRRMSSRPGTALNMEQELASGLGAFVRASLIDGSKEAYEFTEIDKSVSFYLSLKGNRWDRHDNTVGIAAVVNDLSAQAKTTLELAGLAS